MSFHQFEAVSSLAHSGFAGTYTTLVSSIPSEAIELIIVSSLDADVMLSLDGGTTDHIPIPAGVDATAGIVGSGIHHICLAPDSGYCKHAGSSIKVKDIGTPTKGSIYAAIRSRV